MADLVRGHAFAQTLTLVNQGEPVRDADDTTDLPGEPTDTEVAGDIWALGVQQQILDGDVVVADYACLVPPGSPITNETTVTCDGATYTVHGRPEPRRSLRTGIPDHIEARLKFISDTQGAST